MSQNDKLLLEKGLPILSKEQKSKLRGKWQSQTWDDMLLSLNSFGKYIMLRPTGFGKTFTCAAACNIGYKSSKDIKKAEKLNIQLNDENILLNNGNVISNSRLADIHNKKVIFVYVSEILKNTFDNYVKNGMIINGRERVKYVTYASVAKNWDNEEWVRENLDIENVGLVIFDEVQRMGAVETSKALKVAIPFFEKLGIYYIGATATVERSTGYDVCDTYFKYTYPGTNKYTYCWGEHIYSLNETFQNGLIIPPHYQFITDNDKKIKKYRGELRHTRKSMLEELKLMDANDSNRDILLQDIRELQNAVIKNSSKIVHDTMIELYDCDKKYLDNSSELSKLQGNNIERPNKLPKYMRFLVFTPNQQALKSEAKTDDEDGVAQVFGNMVARTYKDFHEAFGRYGYKVRTTIISSANSIEKNNVNLIDNFDLAKAEQLAADKLKIKVKTEEDIELGRAVVPQDLVIDLIFSINMLNVGYHVDGITGIIFKRWTASNQIFLQQLGRCLSSVSDNIPVVFDYVNVVDSRGITAPLYTYDRQNKKVTENADGTTNVVSDVKYTSSKTKNKINKIILNNEGVMLPKNTIGEEVDPSTINNIDAKYIIVDTKTASVDKIISRCNVYQERTVAKKIHNSAYELYSNHIKLVDNKLVSNIGEIPTLESSLRLTILKLDKRVLNSNEFTINFKAYIEFIKNTNKDAYILYDALDEYVKAKGNCEKFKSISDEINSILAASKNKDNIKGANIKLLISEDKIDKLKSNTKVLKLLREKMFKTSEDLIIYQAIK